MSKIKPDFERPIALGTLIEQLGPINNRCRGAEGIEKIEALWDLGDTLLKTSPDAGDSLLKEIHEHSYITRDLLRYGLIIRRGWNDRAELRNQFPRLSRYSLFREALPFLKGNRCGIDPKTQDTILALLNSADSAKAKSFLKQLKEVKIGRSHKKGKAAGRISGPINELRAAMRELFELVEKQPNDVLSNATTIGDDNLLRLSQLSSALAEGNDLPGVPVVEMAGPIAAIRTALDAIKSTNREEQNAVRKVIGAVALMELADFLNAARSNDRFQQWKTRRRASFSV